MSNKKDYIEGYFDDLIGHYVHVECGSWPENYAIKTWGPDFHLKTLKGEIRQVRQHRTTGKPSFHIYFQDTKETYVKLDLDYVLKYSLDIPLKYHELKAEYIVRKAREASAPPKVPDSDSISIYDDDNAEISSNEEENAEVAAQLSTKRKRGGSAPVQLGLAKKKRPPPPKKRTQSWILLVKPKATTLISL
jgi:hypothetical protein